MTCPFIPPYLLDRIAASVPDDPCYPDSLVLDREFRSRRRTRQERSGDGPPFPVRRRPGSSTPPATGPPCRARRCALPASRSPVTSPSTRRPTAWPARWPSSPRSTTGRRTTTPGRRCVRPCTTAATTSTRSGTASSWCSGTATTGGLRPLHHAGRRAGPRVQRTPSSRHTAGLVYREQPGALNESVADVFAGLSQATAAGSDRGPGRTGWSGPGCSWPASHARALRDMARPRNGVRRPGAGQGPPGRPPGRLRGDRRRQRRRAHQLRAFPTGPSTSPRPRSAVTPGTAPGGSGTPRSRRVSRPAGVRLRRLRRGHRRGRR